MRPEKLSHGDPGACEGWGDAAGDPACRYAREAGLNAREAGLIESDLAAGRMCKIAH